MYIPDEILDEYFKLKSLQALTDSDICSFTQSFIAEAIADKYCIKNENGELIHLLDDVFNQGRKISTINNLLTLCKNVGILKDMYDVHGVTMDTPYKYECHDMFTIGINGLEDGIPIDVLEAFYHLIHNHNNGYNADIHITNESGKDIVIKDGDDFFFEKKNVYLGVYSHVDEDENLTEGNIAIHAMFFEEED